ncbi:MAG: hypothetical protein M1434_14260 [Chloroflexi bacterium]|nr:hypothetical protein [Chloroflexota bacterium]MCL5275885.1 hypothetical protein [Chloroflexota bacterium]
MLESTEDFRLGFAIGIIAAEGSFTGDLRKPALQIKMHARDQATLDFLQQMFGGKVYGPYTHGERYYCLWSLRGAELRQSVATFMRYLPESYKRTQFIEWAGRYFKDLLPE